MNFTASGGDLNDLKDMDKLKGRASVAASRTARCLRAAAAPAAASPGV